jgi:hypothetical protein
MYVYGHARFSDDIEEMTGIYCAMYIQGPPAPPPPPTIDSALPASRLNNGRNCLCTNGGVGMCTYNAQVVVGTSTFQGPSKDFRSVLTTVSNQSVKKGTDV